MSDIDKRSGSGPDSRQLLCVAPDNKKVKCNGGVTIGIVIQIKILYSIQVMSTTTAITTQSWKECCLIS